MIRFHRYFSDHTVLQQGMPTRLSGVAAPGGEVCVTLLSGNTPVLQQRCRAGQAGRFTVTITPPPSTGALYTLRADCGNEIAIARDVAVGEVYIAAGQSNMAYPVQYMENREEILAAYGARTDVRFLKIGDALHTAEGLTLRPETPQEELTEGYAFRCGQDSGISEVSGIAAMFALELAGKLHVPVGIVDTAVGGCSIDSYLARSVVDAQPALSGYLQNNGYYHASFQELSDKQRSFTIMSGIYNEKVAPLAGIGMRGVLWYQGESAVNNFESGKYYLAALRAMIEHWRALSGNNGLAFLLSHIAQHHYPYSPLGLSYINEAISLAEQELERVWCTAVYDIPARWNRQDGDLIYHPIHPVNKRMIARRLALLALGNLYRGRPLASPRILRTEREGGCLLAQVESSSPLLSSDGLPLRGFTVCGRDGRYVEAEAVPEGHSIRVYSKAVPEPEAMTYAFAPFNGFCNAAAKNGLPLLPYRSRYEEADGRYYLPQPYTSCAVRYLTENTFGPDYGCNSLRLPVWNKGCINGTKRLRIRYGGGTAPRLEVDYRPDAASFYYIGISPLAGIPGYDFQLEKFTRMRFTVKNKANAELAFLGLFFRSAKNETYCFRPIGTAAPLPVGETAVTLDLTEAVRCDGAVLPAEGLSHDVRALQFTFRSKRAGTLNLSSIRLYRTE